MTLSEYLIEAVAGRKTGKYEQYKTDELMVGDTVIIMGIYREKPVTKNRIIGKAKIHMRPEMVEEIGR